MLVVLDLGQLKAYRLERTQLNTPRLIPVEDIELQEAHQKLLDKVTDQAGRWRVPNERMAMSYGERQKIDLEFRKRLMKQHAHSLHRLLNTPDVEECYLATPKEMHHLILEELEPRIRNKITKNLPCDLTKLSKAELLEHFLKEPALAA
jgi:hypothetical protein